jgi:DNA-binding protein H-NS
LKFSAVSSIFSQKQLNIAFKIQRKSWCPPLDPQDKSIFIVLHQVAVVAAWSVEGNPHEVAIASVVARGTTMRKLNLGLMNFDELWLLHEELTRILAEKISVEKRKLEKRFAQLSHSAQVRENPTPLEERRAARPRRKYPKVLPKYFNPVAPLQTWSGRGKQPKWFTAALRSGHKLDDLRIPDPKKAAASRPRRDHRS